MSQEENAKGTSCCGCLVIVVVVIVVFVVGVSTLLTGGSDSEIESYSTEVEEEEENVAEEDLSEQEDEESFPRVLTTKEARPTGLFDSYSSEEHPETGEDIIIPAGSEVEVESWGNGNPLGGKSRITWEHPDGFSVTGEVFNNALSVPAQKSSGNLVSNDSARLFSIPDGNQHHSVEDSSGSSVHYLEMGTKVQITEWETIVPGRVGIRWEESGETLNGYVEKEHLSPAAKEGEDFPFAVKQR